MATVTSGANHQLLDIVFCSRAQAFSPFLFSGSDYACLTSTLRRLSNICTAHFAFRLWFSLVALKMPPKRTLDVFFKDTVNKKKCTSDPGESEVVDPREAAPAASHEDATVKIVSSDHEASVSQSSSTPPLTCSEVCCALPQEKPFQPKDFKAKIKDRTFQERWYSDFSWITVCSTRNKAFCYACKEANKKGLLNFSKYEDEAFTTRSFNNWKKLLENLR